VLSDASQTENAVDANASAHPATTVTPSSLASIVPTGGLHSSGQTSHTAIFGFHIGNASSATTSLPTGPLGNVKGESNDVRHEEHELPLHL
jgi:hypothetical protein